MLKNKYICTARALLIHTLKLKLKICIYSQFNTFIETQSTYDRDSRELKKIP